MHTCYRVTLFVFGSIFLVIGLLCMTAGYYNNYVYNSNYIPAACHVDSHEFRKVIYIFRCNCVVIGHTWKGNKYKCDSCSEDRYDAYAQVTITNVTTTKVLAYSFGYYDNVYHNINVIYPINSTYGCFYYAPDPSKIVPLNYFGDSQSPYKDTQSSLIAGIVFLSLGGATIIAGVIWTIVVKCINH